MIRHTGDREGMTGQLIEVIAALLKRNVRFIICGGWAVVLHGVRRMTVDLDLSLDMDSGNLRCFLDAMQDLRLTPAVPVPPEFLLDDKMRQFMVSEKNAAVFSFIDPDNPYRQVDVMLTEEGSYDRLYPDSVPVEIGGYTVRIASVNGLIHMKELLEHPRQKDLQDILDLRKLSPSEWQKPAGSEMQSENA
jgi:hypothetical protein